MPVFPSDLRAGSDVFSADGHKLGELHRVVLKRSDLTVSHVVVDIGFLRSGRSIWQGGFGLDYDRVTPIDQVEEATQERVTLKLTGEAFKDMPEYSEEYYEQPYDLTPGRFDLPDVVNRVQGMAAMINSTSNLWLHERLNRPLDSVDIQEGTDVWRREPHQKLGDVTTLLFDEASGQLQALVISRGFVFKQEVVLPVRHIIEIYDDLVRVDIADDDLAQLPEYQPE